MQQSCTYRDIPGYPNLINKNNSKLKDIPIYRFVYLRIPSMIGVLGHLERVASCPHNSPVNLGLPLYASKRAQRAAISTPYYVPIQNAVQLHWHPAPSGIGLVRERQSRLADFHLSTLLAW